MAWGGEAEQAAEIQAGNPDAKNWQREAEAVIEATVCVLHPSALTVSRIPQDE
jgi:hypothetical protein